MDIQDEFRFCGNPDYMGASNLCKWDKKEITWTISGQVSGLSFTELKSAYETAWSYWSEVCGLTSRYVSTTSQAMVVMGSGQIDGPGRTLAWSEMPCGRVSSLDQRYDTSEKWIIDENPAGKGFDIVRVACHEIGHAIGIPHIANGNLMAPHYSSKIRRPQDEDTQEAQLRYGKPVPKPSPDDGTSIWAKLIAQLLESLLKWFSGR